MREIDPFALKDKYSQHSDFTRAKILSYLQELTHSFNQLDESLIFHCFNIADRYMSIGSVPNSTFEMQLTFMASLLINSKRLEIFPIDVESCLQHIGLE